MGVSVQVVGLPELLTVRRKLKAVGDAGLGKPMARKLKAAAGPIQRDVRAETATLPKSEGFAETLARSLRFTTKVNTSRVEALLVIRVYGKAVKDRRDIAAINRGRLRHPVFGRTRRVKRHWVYGGVFIANPWVTQLVRPGFVDRPFDANKRQVARTVGEVLDEFIDDIKGR